MFAISQPLGKLRIWFGIGHIISIYNCKNDKQTCFSRIGRAFLLAEPSAMGWLLSFRNCKIVKLLAEFHFHPYQLNTINSLRFFEEPSVFISGYF
jgi:hypothetical protein